MRCTKSGCTPLTNKGKTDFGFFIKFLLPLMIFSFFFCKILPYKETSAVYEAGCARPENALAAALPR